MDVVACTASGRAVTVAGPDGETPLVAALSRPDHVGLVTETEATLLRRWAAAGAPAIRGGVHTAAFVDPRSPESHGAVLRAKHYTPMLDAADRDACGRCHNGLGVGREPATFPAPGATPCTTCHTEEGGPFACTTCHGVPAARGKPGRAYPPRDLCFHPDAGETGHPAHAGPSASRAEGLACSTCHPSPALGSLAPPHADGHVAVWFDPAVAGAKATFDASTKKCTGTCHARGGARPEVVWTEAVALGCNDCHKTPPPAHYQGPCSACHREANATGTALVMPLLHANGRVDLGNGSGTCGACHGNGSDPWPGTGAHRAHASPTNSRPVACESCHELPQPGAQHPTGKGSATVRFGALAVNGARRPTYDPATKTCAGTYCHEYVGGTVQAPRWDGGASQAACGTCHAVPPPPPHIQDVNCASAGCHEGLTSTDAKRVLPLGIPSHVDGVVDRKPK